MDEQRLVDVHEFKFMLYRFLSGSVVAVYFDNN